MDLRVLQIGSNAVVFLPVCQLELVEALCMLLPKMWLCIWTIDAFRLEAEAQGIYVY